LEDSAVLAGVGFFHFVENQWKDPLGSLETALEGCDCLDNRLIVLPEAFNVGANYREGVLPTIPAKQALERLAEFSGKYGVVFVAGLLHKIDRYNSAFLVDAALQEHPWRLLCHKGGWDGVGNYQPCSATPIHSENPFHCKGVHVGSLICVDANFPRAMEDRLYECSGPTLLCIPAWMDDTFAPDGRVACLPGPYRVLANSDPSGCGSFITNRDGRKVAQIGGKTQPLARNTLVVRSWAEIDGSSETLSAR
jgi:hypothetical protein